MAPYFVQLRDFERSLVAGALEAGDGSPDSAAEILGIGVRFLRKRASIIGGFLGHEVYEPPKTSEAGSGYPFDKSRRQARDDAFVKPTRRTRKPTIAAAPIATTAKDHTP